MNITQNQIKMYRKGVYLKLLRMIKTKTRLK